MPPPCFWKPPAPDITPPKLVEVPAEPAARLSVNTMLPAVPDSDPAFICAFTLVTPPLATNDPTVSAAFTFTMPPVTVSALLSLRLVPAFRVRVPSDTEVAPVTAPVLVNSPVELCARLANVPELEPVPAPVLVSAPAVSVLVKLPALETPAMVPLFTTVPPAPMVVAVAIWPVAATVVVPPVTFNVPAPRTSFWIEDAPVKLKALVVPFTVKIAPLARLIVPPAPWLIDPMVSDPLIFVIEVLRLYSVALLASAPPLVVKTPVAPVPPTAIAAVVDPAAMMNVPPVVPIVPVMALAPVIVVVLPALLNRRAFVPPVTLPAKLVETAPFRFRVLLPSATVPPATEAREAMVSVV